VGVAAQVVKDFMWGAERLLRVDYPLLFPQGLYFPWKLEFSLIEGLLKEVEKLFPKHARDLPLDFVAYRIGAGDSGEVWAWAGISAREKSAPCLGASGVSPGNIGRLPAIPGASLAHALDIVTLCFPERTGSLRLPGPHAVVGTVSLRGSRPLQERDFDLLGRVE